MWIIAAGIIGLVVSAIFSDILLLPRNGFLVLYVIIVVLFLYGYVWWEVVQPLIGNAMITVGYLLTSHPTTPIGVHVAMHIAAVLHGMETTVQLPPHY